MNEKKELDMMDSTIQNAINFGALILVLLLSGWEFLKAIGILFSNKSYLLFAAQVSLLFLRIFPPQMRNRRDEIMLYYEKRKKTYAVFTLIGGVYMIFVSLIWLFMVLT